MQKLNTNNILKVVIRVQRDITARLIDWKQKTKRKPLVIMGVRQCGKTYIVDAFGKDQYDDLALFNFERQEVLSKIFETDYDIDRIIFELGLFLGRTIQPKKTLIFFDEIQACSRAITSLKYFCENAPEYHIICAGSLLGVKTSSESSFPVGKVEFITMYPMSFSEFVRATGEEMLADYIINFDTSKKIPEAIGNKMSYLLRQYYVTGGMPEVVQTWCETKDISQVEAKQQAILDGYEFDFAKHAPIKDFPKLTAIWKSIPVQLARENNKFIFGHVKKGWRSKDLEDALEWLINAGLVYKVCQIEKPFLPLSAYEKPTAFKLYLCDVGLLRKLSNVPYQVILDSSTIYTEFKGAMTENYVLGELVKNVCETPYYWVSGNTAEVDFVIQSDSEIIPIEVKSEKNVKARSLAEYCKKYHPEYAIKTSMKNEIFGNGIFNIPLYIISSLNKFIVN